MRRSLLRWARRGALVLVLVAGCSQDGGDPQDGGSTPQTLPVFTGVQAFDHPGGQAITRTSAGSGAVYFHSVLSPAVEDPIVVESTSVLDTLDAAVVRTGVYAWDPAQRYGAFGISNHWPIDGLVELERSGDGSVVIDPARHEYVLFVIGILGTDRDRDALAANFRVEFTVDGRSGTLVLPHTVGICRPQPTTELCAIDDPLQDGLA